MNTLNFKLSACAISAAALLAACGGGGTIPDTTAPTVAITDNVSDATMTSGDVTFTFTFSEAVTGFITDDITVSGGTKGSFNMASTGLTATLVVTPTANSSGSINVAVAATKFKDAAGLDNTASASGTQAFNTVVAPPPSNNLVTNGDFSNGSTGWTGNAANVRTNESFNFADVTVAGNPWDVGLQYVLAIPTSGVNYKLKFKAWSNTNRTLIAGIGLNGAPYTNTTQTVNLTTTEQTFELNLTSNFASDNSRIIFDMGAAVGQVLIDNVVLETVTSTPAASFSSLTYDEATAPTLTPFGVNTAPPEIVTDPSGGTNKVLKVYKVPGSEQWAGVTVSTAASQAVGTIPFTATAKTMTLRVYSPAAGVRVRLKVENAGDNTISCETDAITTSAGAWETLTFNFANPGTSPPVGGGATSALDLTKTYNKVSIFSDFGLGAGGYAALPADRIYYFDTLTFVP